MSKTITTYRVTATFDRDGQIQTADQAEVLGDTYGKTYTDRGEVEALVEDMQGEVEEYGLDPSTTYAIESIEHTIEIGAVVEEWTSEDDDGKPVYDELDAYVSVRAVIDGQPCDLGVGIGVQKYEQGSAKASGAGVSFGGGPTAWWVDSSDHQDVADALKDTALEALSDAAPRLWRETMAMRPEQG